MTWNFNRFSDGDGLDNLSTELTAASTWFNAIDGDGVRRGCFNLHHGLDVLSTTGTGSTSGSTERTYDHATFSTALEWSGYATDGATDAGANNPSTFDRIVLGHPDTSAGATATISGMTNRVGMDNAASAAQKQSCLIVLGNVQVTQVNVGALSDVFVVLCLQYRINVSDWYTIDHSEVHLSVEDHIADSSPSGYERIDFDVPLLGIVTPALVTDNGDTPGSDSVTEVRICVSMRGTGTFGGSEGIRINRWNLTAIGPFSEDV